MLATKYTSAREGTRAGATAPPGSLHDGPRKRHSRHAQRRSSWFRCIRVSVPRATVDSAQVVGV